MKQRAFSYKGYSSDVADYVNSLISGGWRIVSMTSIAPIASSNQMDVVIVAEQ